MKTAEEILEKHFPTPEGSHDTESIIGAMQEYTAQFTPKWIPVKQGDQVEEGRYFIWFDHPTRGGYMDQHFLIDDMPYKYGTYIQKIVDPTPPTK